MKSLLQLLNVIGEEGEEKLRFQTLKIFFSTAGRMRDVEMNQSLLRKISREEKVLLPSFQQSFRSLLRITRANTRSAAALPLEQEISELTQKVRLVLSKLTEDECTEKTTEEVFRQLEVYRSGLSFSDKETHALRKKMKRIYYWLGYLPVNTCFTEKQMKQLDRALVTLGHWQDHTVFRSRLRAFRQQYLANGSEEYEHSQKLEAATRLIRDQWKAKAEELLKKLLV